MLCLQNPRTPQLFPMAATASSSNSVSNSPLHKLEPKQEHLLPKQEPILPKQEPKQEQQKDVKSETIDEDIKEVKIEPIEDPFDEMDDDQQLEKFKRYEADFKQYLMSKYFSDKTVFGGNIFDVKVNTDGETTMASRLAPYQSYLDPGTFHELLAKESVSVETKPDIGSSNGKP